LRFSAQLPASFSMLAARGAWAMHLRCTVFEDGKKAWAGMSDKRSLELKVKENIGMERQYLVGTNDAPMSDGERKDAVGSFARFLSGLGITQRPKSSDQQAICTRCGRIARVNATDWATHAARGCETDHPERATSAVRIAKLKTTAVNMGAVARAGIAAIASEHTAELSQSHVQPSPFWTKRDLEEPARSAAVAGSGLMRKHLDRELSVEQVKVVDEMLCRFCFAEGLSFRTLMSPFLHKALAKLNTSWAKQTRLSTWNIRHSFLNDESDHIDALVKDSIESAFALTLLSDGWCGLQKEHELNILIAMPVPLFLTNLFTYADRVNGEYQVCPFAPACDASACPR
jgi:hypothetical protein